MTEATRSDALESAKALDEQGRHAESMDVLKQGIAKGDLLAMSELAHRLLTGDRAPKSPKHALYFLKEASKAGDGRALARLAALTAGGAYVPQDWASALALLGQAASAGDLSAQGQLSSLLPDDKSDSDWQGRAARVGLDWWLSPAVAERLHENVYKVPQMAPESVCKWLIGRAAGRLGPALVYDSVSKEAQLHEMRTNTMAMFDFGSFDVVQFLVQERMSRTCGYPIQHFEAPMILHYEVGQQITPHFDFIDAQAADYAEQIRQQGQRMVTYLLYLNDSYEGGETTFPKLGIVNHGSIGSGLYFINAHSDLSPDRRMLHTGSPPTRGEKWIVSQFIVSKRLRP